MTDSFDLGTSISIDYKPNIQGIRGLLKSPGAVALVGQGAERIANNAEAIGTGRYGSKTRIQSVSVHGYAYTANYQAMLETAETDVLAGAIR